MANDNNVAHRVIAGLDIGNGYTKVQVSVDGAQPVLLDAPSSAARVVRADLPHECVSQSPSERLNDLDASIVSGSIRSDDQRRWLFGKRAVHNSTQLTSFDIHRLDASKCDESLSSMLTLASISSAVLSHVFDAEGALPSQIMVDVVAVMALPIEDYKRHADGYARRLENDVHRVLVHNFGDVVEVVIRFVKVAMLPEGAAAQYAITNLGPLFLQKALDDARKSGVAIDESITGEHLAAACDTIGVDVGEGTVNFPVFEDGKVSIEASYSINNGFGVVLEAARDSLEGTSYSFHDRKEYADFLVHVGKSIESGQYVFPKKRAQYERALDAVNRNSDVLCSSIEEGFNRVFNVVGNRTDVVYVFGGGAVWIREMLWPRLLNRIGEGGVPVIYLDSYYSRNLNRTGLYVAAKAESAALGW
jgi:plasmid segregation protein ParM